MFAPLTESGTIYVNDILASNYLSFNHQIAHSFMFPLRIYRKYF
jgi:hypothetical protein